MSFQIKRMASSTSKKKHQQARVWRHSNKVSVAKFLLNSSPQQGQKFYMVQRSTMAYSSVEFKPKIRTKSTLQSIMMSSNAGFQKLKISSRSWCLYDALKEKYVGFREKNQREIASLTKIMTTIISIQFMQKYDLNPQLHIKVTQNASRMIGTSASLQHKTWIKFRDLLYGAMLPSGNDAAYLLSQIIGHFQKFQHRNPQYLRNIKFLDLCSQNTTLYTVQFVKEMNRKAQQIGMELTQFSNPHGLQNAMNVSCPKDLIKLSCYAAQNDYFRRIMNTIHHRYQYVQLVDATDDKQQELSGSRNIGAEEGNENRSNNTKQQKIRVHRSSWQNTNILLKKGWQGVKTGQTGPAGSCLSSLKNNIYIVVLNCKDNQARFYETQKIYSWYLSTRKTQSTDDDEDNFKQFK